MDTRPAPLEDWYGAFSRAWRSPESVATLPCPNCRRKQLVFRYIRYPGATQSHVLFYCANCLVGIPPDPGLPPTGIEPGAADTLDIPNFRLAVARDFM